MIFFRKIKNWSKPYSFRWQNWFQSKLKTRLHYLNYIKLHLFKMTAWSLLVSVFLPHSYKVNECLAMTHQMQLHIHKYLENHFLVKAVLLPSFTLLICVEGSIAFVGQEHREKQAWSPKFTVQIHDWKSSTQNPILALDWKDAAIAERTAGQWKFRRNK